jgi:two-component system, cell cycle sensor histidine kinase and response regulator CckA
MIENEKPNNRAQRYLDIAGTMIVALDHQGVITLINRKGAEVLACSQEEIVGKSWFENFLPESMRSVVTATFERLMHGELESTEYYENMVVTKAGEERLIAWHNQLLHDETGKISGTLSSGEDVTDRRQTERELAALFAMSADLICIADINTGMYLKINPAFEGCLGYSEAELLSRPIPEFVHPDDVEKTMAVFNDLLKGEAVLNFENRYVCKDGSYRLLQWVSHPWNEQGIAFGVARDITELRRTQAQSNRSQKLESLGRLAGGVAHDFNNLVTVISGNVSLALDQLDASNPLYELLMEIKEASVRTTGLTNQLLAFGRKQMIEPRVIELTELLAGLEKLLKRLIGEEIQMVWQLDPTCGRVKADPSQIEQVIVNLVINARDAMPDGGRLIIETGRIELDSSYADAHPGVKAGLHVMMAVSDSGCGMTAEEISCIFEPFYTTKKNEGGSGLGLATSFGTVQQHGGSVEVYSEVGSGSTFKVYLPLVDEPAESVAKPASKFAETEGSETILLVEDETLVRTVALRILQKKGYTVYAAADGVSAMELIEKKSLTIDMLLTDVIMPNMNGRELADKLLARWPGLNVLFTSGYTENVIAHRGVLDDNINFISKPYSPLSLAVKVREILDS